MQAPECACLCQRDSLKGCSIAALRTPLLQQCTLPQPEALVVRVLHIGVAVSRQDGHDRFNCQTIGSAICSCTCSRLVSFAASIWPEGCQRDARQ